MGLEVALRSKASAPEFARSDAADIRINGLEGMGQSLDPADWKLTVAGLAATGDMSLGMDEITRFLGRR